MAITLDFFAIGALLGYTPEEVKSIKGIRIEGSDKRITVTRFVQDPDSLESKRASVNEGDVSGHFTNRLVEDSHGSFPSLVVDDILSFRPKTHSQEHASGPTEYVKLSKQAVKALRERQGGQYAEPRLFVLSDEDLKILEDSDSH